MFKVVSLATTPSSFDDMIPVVAVPLIVMFGLADTTHERCACPRGSTISSASPAASRSPRSPRGIQNSSGSSSGAGNVKLWSVLACSPESLRRSPGVSSASSGRSGSPHGNPLGGGGGLTRAVACNPCPGGMRQQGVAGGATIGSFSGRAMGEASTSAYGATPPRRMSPGRQLNRAVACNPCPGGMPAQGGMAGASMRSDSGRVIGEASMSSYGATPPQRMSPGVQLNRAVACNPCPGGMGQGNVGYGSTVRSFSGRVMGEGSASDYGASPPQRGSPGRHLGRAVACNPCPGGRGQY